MTTQTVIVIAAHGAPARDFPRGKVGLLMAFEMSPVGRLPLFSGWRARLEAEVRAWPRTRESDPYQAAVDDLAAALEAELGHRVLVGYNEFCSPTVSDALDQAAAEGAQRVIVIPTMLLRGNEHTEAEIAGAVAETRQRHPAVTFEYAWPFNPSQMLALFAGQVRSVLQNEHPRIDKQPCV
jgi:sirohydrochlorin cobaltochelatase